MRQPNATDEQIRQEAARIVSSYDTVGPEGMPKEMNFGIYPILSLPLDEMVSDDRPYDTGTYRKCRFAKGSTCRIKTESTYGFYHTCQVYYQYDTYDDRSIEFGVIQGCSVISDSYDLSDAIEDARVAQSPEIKPGQEIRIFVYSKRCSVGFLVKAWVSRWFNESCSSPVAILGKEPDPAEGR